MSKRKEMENMEDDSKNRLEEIFFNQKLKGISVVEDDKEGEPFLVVFNLEGKGSSIGFKCISRMIIENQTRII